MHQLVYYRPPIAPDEFLPIFVVSTLVLLFGIAYAGLITLSKMGFFSKKWQVLGYIMWILQAYSLYELSIMIHSGLFTSKVLFVTMVAYLFIPHLYFYLVDGSDKRYEHEENSTK